MIYYIVIWMFHRYHKVGSTNIHTKIGKRVQMEKKMNGIDIHIQLSIDCAQSFDGFIAHLYSGDKKTPLFPSGGEELQKPCKNRVYKCIGPYERDATRKG